MPSDADRLREIAAEIAAELLTNGAGERAERLVLTTAGRDLGGWSHGPLSDRIASMLAARLDAPPAGGGVPGEVLEVARVTLNHGHGNEGARIMARWILAQPAAREEQTNAE